MSLALVVDERAAVKVPDDLSNEEAATLPCAGVTAWNAPTYGTPTLPFDRAPAAFEKIKAGGTFGKICVTM